MAYAVVTGASRGIGLAIAKKLAADGYSLFLLARNEEKLAQVVNGLRLQYGGQSFYSMGVDLSKKEEIAKVGEALAQYSSNLHVLVNNAGGFIPGKLSSEEDGTFELMWQQNVMSAYVLTRVLLPFVRKTIGGTIVNISSTAGLMAYANGGSYAIAKHAMSGFSKTLREELKLEKIKVTTIFPGATFTDSWEGSGLPEDRFIQVQDIAELVSTVVKLSPSACVEEILIRPVLGDI